MAVHCISSCLATFYSRLLTAHLELSITVQLTARQHRFSWPAVSEYCQYLSVAEPLRKVGPNEVKTTTLRSDGYANKVTSRAGMPTSRFEARSCGA